MTPFRRSDDLAQRQNVANAEFGSSEGSLFSPEDVKRLMRVEFERAQRYKYPLACFLIAVDRLDRLHDLYGVECKDTILRSLGELTRSETRASDMLGVMLDDRLLVMIPHTPPAGARALAKRLLDAARKLKFESDGRGVRISIAIGGSHNQTARPIPALFYETLLSVAESGLDVAMQGGGDRYVHTELYDWFQRRAERDLPKGVSTPSPSPGTLFGQDQSSPAQQPYVEGLRIFANGIRGAIPSAPAVPVSPPVLSGERESEYQRTIENLERRIAKLNDMLGKTESDLARLASVQGVDTGLASKYKGVQGLSPFDEAQSLKKELMQKIFQANLELKNAVSKQAPGN